MLDKMENIKEKIKYDKGDNLKKTIAEMERSGIEVAAKEFRRGLREFFSGIEEEGGLEGIERIKRDLDVIFKDRSEKDFLEVLRGEIDNARKALKEFDDSRIKPFRAFLVKSMPQEVKPSDYEQRQSKDETKVPRIEDVIKDKKIVVEKIKKTRSAAEEYLNKSNLLKKENSAAYVCLAIRYLNVVQKEMEELDDILDKYEKLLEEEIAKIKN